jgi:hypothetical protein
MRSAARPGCDRELRGPKGLFAAILFAFLMAVAGSGDVRPSAPHGAAAAPALASPAPAAQAGAEASERHAGGVVLGRAVVEAERRAPRADAADAPVPSAASAPAVVGAASAPRPAAGPTTARGDGDPRLSTGPPAAVARRA